MTPGADGHSMTNIEDGGGSETASTGVADVTTNETVEKNNEFVDESGTNTDPERGETAGEAGELPQEGEGQAGPEEVSPEGEVEAPAFDPEAFEERILSKIQERIQPPAPPREISEQEWVAQEERFGVPRQAIQAFTEQNVQVYNKLRDYVDEQFAGIRKDSTLRAISQEKGYMDALKYPKEIEQFLSNYNPKHHSNPELLKMAVVYSRGLAASKNIQRARTDGEKNRKIAGAARPSSPGTPSANRNGKATLNASQRDVASKFGMSESEYSALMKKRGTPIAI